MPKDRLWNFGLPRPPLPRLARQDAKASRRRQLPRSPKDHLSSTTNKRSLHLQLQASHLTTNRAMQCSARLARFARSRGIRAALSKARYLNLPKCAPHHLVVRLQQLQLKDPRCRPSQACTSRNSRLRQHFALRLSHIGDATRSIVCLATLALFVTLHLASIITVMHHSGCLKTALG